MIPGQKKPTDQAELFSASTAKEIQDILWKAADKLRGSIDAAQYKEFVLGLIFLKYVSDAFEQRRTELARELAEDGIADDRLDDFLEDRDEYTGAHVFWVPETARWSWIAANGKSQGVGKLLDDAMDAIMRENAALTGVLPKIFNRDNVDQKRLGELVDLISDARFGGSENKPAQDVLGEVYEYFLGNFARAEGKRGGEFYTPGPSSSCSWRFWSRTRAGCTTRRAARAACSSKQPSSSRHTEGAATRPTSRSMARSSTSGRGVWAR